MVTILFVILLAWSIKSYRDSKWEVRTQPATKARRVLTNQPTLSWAGNQDLPLNLIDARALAAPAFMRKRTPAVEKLREWHLGGASGPAKRVSRSASPRRRGKKSDPPAEVILPEDIDFN
jgi:hypothetical protein